MRFAVASYHLPDPEGSAAGRILHATTTGLLAEGHEVRVWSWGRRSPGSDLPPWAEWRPVPEASRLRIRARAAIRPRSEVVRAQWPFPVSDGDVAVADEFLSFPALARHPRSVLTLHYATALDAAALGTRSAAAVQERRAERWAARRASLVLAYSDRVAEAAAAPATWVPAAYPVPPEARPPVERPVAAVVGDWRWAPNRWALDRLLRAWPDVCRAVAGARLRLAGAGLDAVGTMAGVEVLGPVASSGAVLAETAVVAFPCPPTSGPKIKVLEALATGVAVVTTPAGMEGLAVPAGAGGLVTDAEPTRFAADLALLLGDPDRADALGRSGREAVARAHGPRPAARARLAACQAALRGGSEPG